MSGLQFAELRPPAAESCSSTDWRCAMTLSSTKGRCTQHIPRRAVDAQELYDRLREDEHIDEIARAQVLKEIAKLTLCDVHCGDEDIDAAVEQWQGQGPFCTRPAESAAPQTPKAKKGSDERLIEFVSYTGTKSKINPDDPKQIDAKIRDILARKIAKQDNHVSYLYVFSQKKIKKKRFYKIGLTWDLATRQKNLERCYGPLELHCFVECPNVKMFEDVVHAELLQYRRVHLCEEDTCEVDKHTEWFEASLDEILDTVTAWSLYARMLYRCGSSLDRNHQSVPMPGWLTRPDRWRRFALGEATRWMDEIPSNVTVIPEKEMPQSPTETEALDEPGSEPESTFSSPASLSDTPRTTPETTPGTSPDSYGDEKEDYGLTPTPAARHMVPDGVDEEDEYPVDRVGQPAKRVERKLSFGSMRRQEVSSDKSPNTPSTAGGGAAHPDAGSVSETSPTDTQSSGMIETTVQKALEEYAAAPEDPGTIYLTVHAERETYKIFHRGPRTLRKNRSCYSKPDHSFAITCTNKAGVQNLVLAQFESRVHWDTCGYERCRTEHKDWIHAPVEDLKASLCAWSELLEVGYDVSDIPKKKDLSQDENGWTTWARETAAARRGTEEARRNEGKNTSKKKNAESKTHTTGKTQEEEPPSGSDEEPPVEESHRRRRQTRSHPADVK
ncbi:hypothetical protein BJY00DRAFT_286332 [Aspergillus carlsbadensis]|nr:hypothetical protein BJY00DRAFT_286332 [Aspergillus carlsbadensis]